MGIKESVDQADKSNAPREQKVNDFIVGRNRVIAGILSKV